MLTFNATSFANNDLREIIDRCISELARRAVEVYKAGGEMKVPDAIIRLAKEKGPIQGIKAYRELNPDISLSAAKAIIQYEMLRDF